MNDLRKNFFSLSTLFFVFTVWSVNIKADLNPDSLKFYGHAFVQIKTSDGKNIYIDPYNVNAFKDSADIVLITHEHSDHNEISRVKQKKNCQVIRVTSAIKAGAYQSFTIGNIKVTAAAAYNSNHPKGSSVGYVVEFDGIKLYHSGDTGKITEMADLTAQNIDYALLCMDGVYTMSPEAATQAAAVINAKHDIPIHTMPPPDTYSDAIVARFTSPNKLVVKHGESIELSKSITSDVEKDNTLPEGFELNQNYPNPFNPETYINFSIGTTGHVTLQVFDMLGRMVATILDEEKSAGRYNVTFGIKTLHGASLPSGVYFYRLTAGGFVQTKKMILIK